ncbi:LysR family transcriptional regulator [Cocleimonas flava]|uniref:DNA-binding transcriptional LysR family regulator n=1 Tax=Cocleimonas flava TaxID=634765 RepID=A0A4R1F550_9GAMM|nr:LysR family transcriptional regulator [Cocleimonas flava]TCJ87802.1 DNA-binding transcriptional LysR family regulator [Cocleimonas flava]
MDIEQIRTFLAVASNGSFIEAASRLYITQSTVSARIQNLENNLQAKLFIRNRSGATLTSAGKRFLRHAKTLMLTMEQAKHDVGLPNRYHSSLIIGARIALWDGELLPQWVGELRNHMPDVSINSIIGFEEDLMRRMTEGTLDIALMYTPQHNPGLQIEHLFDETLVLVGTKADKPWPDENYVYVDWGPGFYAEHSNHFPQLERPALLANIGWLAVQLVIQNGGSCFLPKRMAEPLIASGTLALIPDSPEFNLPAYVVYPENVTAVEKNAENKGGNVGESEGESKEDKSVHQQAIQILHQLIKQ